MTKLTLVAIFFVFAFAGSALGQSSGGYTIDNFDFANGVRIEQSKKNLETNRAARRNSPDWLRTQAPLMRPLPSRSRQTSIQSLVGGVYHRQRSSRYFIAESGNRNAVDPLLLYSIMHQESTFKRALSPKGASGLMQLMPATARRLGFQRFGIRSRTSMVAPATCASCWITSAMCNWLWLDTTPAKAQ